MGLSKSQTLLLTDVVSFCSRPVSLGSPQDGNPDSPSQAGLASCGQRCRARGPAHNPFIRATPTFDSHVRTFLTKPQPHQTLLPHLPPSIRPLPLQPCHSHGVGKKNPGPAKSPLTRAPAKAWPACIWRWRTCKLAPAARTRSLQQRVEARAHQDHATRPRHHLPPHVAVVIDKLIPNP